MKKPNFFIIGAPKSGTTALSEYLRQHPEVYFSDPKEPQFFATDFKNGGAITDVEEYLSLFSDAKEHHKVIAEGSTKYLRSSVAIEKIIDFSPGSKFLVMLRNPLEMAVSLHEQVLFNGEEDVEDFETAWRLQEKRKNGMFIPKFCQEPFDLQYGYMCRIGEQIESLLKRVDKNQIKIIFFEDFAKDNKAAYLEILKFLNLTEVPLKDCARVNQGKRIKYPVIKYLTRLLAKLKKKLHINRKFGLIKAINLMNSKGSKRPPLATELKKEMEKYFDRDIELLERLTQRDLSHWIER